MARTQLDPLSAAIVEAVEPVLRRVVREELAALEKRSSIASDRIAMTLKQVSVATGLSLTRLKDDARAGKLQTIKKGKARIVTPEALEAYLADTDGR
jgi:hypothetical protein